MSQLPYFKGSFIIIILGAIGGSIIEETELFLKR